MVRIPLFSTIVDWSHRIDDVVSNAHVIFSAAPPMRRYLWISLALAGTFLAGFGIAEALGIPLLTDPMPALRAAGPLAGAIGVGLLIADVVLPVPSSVIMIAHGALFGVWIGSILSLVGSVGCS